MSDFASTLSKKAGPLPIGVWIAAVGGGAGLYLSHKRKAATSASSATATTDSAGSPTDTAGSGDQTAGVGTGPGGWQLADPTTNGTATTTAPAITTNQQWFQDAETKLIAQGYDAITVDTALRRYITGTPMTASDYSVVKLALQLEGPTPESLGAPTGNSPTTPIPVKPPTAASPVKKAKYADRTAAVGRVGSWTPFVLYIKALYPGLTTAQVTKVAYATANDPANKEYKNAMAINVIPGGARVLFKGSVLN